MAAAAVARGNEGSSMRAEIEAVAGEIRGSLALLRRHL
jgi:hypothetical protein